MNFRNKNKLSYFLLIREELILKNQFILNFVYEIYQNLIYDWYSDKMQPYFEEVTLEINHVDNDAFIFSFEPKKRLIDDLKQFTEVFVFRNLDPSQELHSKITKN